MAMIRRMIRILALVLVGASCGSNPAAPSWVQVAGTWTGTQTLVKVSGGECVGEVASSLVGAVAEFVLVVTQSGSSLHATTGGCSFSGSAGSATFTLELDPASCQGVERNLVCANGAVRDMSVRGGTLSGTVSGNIASGVATYADNVFVAGTTTAVGVLVYDLTFSIKR